ncbi:hypothetical protein [Vibrio owensii]|uniref:hypothetical protein n=1 Tax=Vibrio owensii TaxID=696485 RepID=UPI004068D91B
MNKISIKYKGITYPITITNNNEYRINGVLFSSLDHLVNSVCLGETLEGSSNG